MWRGERGSTRPLRWKQSLRKQWLDEVINILFCWFVSGTVWRMRFLRFQNENQIICYLFENQHLLPNTVSKKKLYLDTGNAPTDREQNSSAPQWSAFRFPNCNAYQRYFFLNFPERAFEHKSYTLLVVWTICSISSAISASTGIENLPIANSPFSVLHCNWAARQDCVAVKIEDQWTFHGVRAISTILL